MMLAASKLGGRIGSGCGVRLLTESASASGVVGGGISGNRLGLSVQITKGAAPVAFLLAGLVALLTARSCSFVGDKGRVDHGFKHAFSAQFPQHPHGQRCADHECDGTDLTADAPGIEDANQRLLLGHAIRIGDTSKRPSNRPRSPDGHGLDVLPFFRASIRL